MRTSLRSWLVGLASLGLVATPAFAQEEMDDVAVGSNIYGSLDFGYASSYYFFGIPQENQGVILQTTLNLGVTLPSINLGDDMELSQDVYAGTFNSFHFDNPTSDEDFLGGTDDALSYWYEGDIFVGYVLGLPYGLTLDISYWWVNGPSVGAQFDEEIDIFLSYDDTAMWESAGMDGFALNPYIAFIIETQGGADGNVEDDGGPGKLFLLGVEPSFPVYESEDYPVTLSIPVEVGIEIEDYYENVAGESESFGYLSFGATLSTPLSFIPAEYGEWEGYIGAYGILLGDAAKETGGPDGLDVIGDDAFAGYWSTGVSLSF